MDSPRIELGSPPRQGGVVPLDHEPIFLFQWTSRGVEPGTDWHGCQLVLLVAGQASSRWTSSPIFMLREVRSGIEPELRPYQGRVLPQHLQTNFKTQVIPAGVEPALSCMSRRRLCRWTTGSEQAGGWRPKGLEDRNGICSGLRSPVSRLLVTEVGVEPTKSSHSQRDRFSCLRTRSL